MLETIPIFPIIIAALTGAAKAGGEFFTKSILNKGVLDNAIIMCPSCGTTQTDNIVNKSNRKFVCECGSQIIDQHSNVTPRTMKTDRSLMIAHSENLRWRPKLGTGWFDGDKVYGYSPILDAYTVNCKDENLALQYTIRERGIEGKVVKEKEVFLASKNQDMKFVNTGTPWIDCSELDVPGDHLILGAKIRHLDGDILHECGNRILVKNRNGVWETPNKVRS